MSINNGSVVNKLSFVNDLIDNNTPIFEDDIAEAKAKAEAEAKAKAKAEAEAKAKAEAEAKAKAKAEAEAKAKAKAEAEAKAKAEAEAKAKAEAEAKAKAKAEAEAKAKAKAEAEAKAKAEAEAKAKAKAEAEAKAKAKAEAEAKAKAEAEAKANEELEADKLKGDFIDYVPSKLIGMTIATIEGNRIDHNSDIGIAATGKVTLKVKGNNIFFGILTKDSLLLSQDALNLPIRTGDRINYESVVAIKLEIEKIWCYGVKMQVLKSKEVKAKTKQQEKLDRMNAIASIL